MVFYSALFSALIFSCFSLLCLLSINKRGITQTPLQNEESQVIQNNEYFNPNKRYFVYLPYQGMGNQLMQLARAIEIAKRTNRILVLPPLVASSHNSEVTTQQAIPKEKQYMKRHLLADDWKHYFNLDYFLKDFPHIQWQLPVPFPLQKLTCYTYSKWINLWRFGDTTNNFIKYFKPLRVFLATLPTKERNPTLSFISNFLNEGKRKRASVLCVGNLQHINGEAVELDFLSKLNYSIEIQNIVKAAIKKQKKASNSNVLVGIHLRRGDFGSACKINKIKERCLPSFKQIQNRLASILQHQDNPQIVIVSNRKQNEEALSKYNWKQLSWEKDLNSLFEHYYLQSETAHSVSSYERKVMAEKFAVFAPAVLDQAFLSYCEIFVGNIYSTFSKKIYYWRKRKESGKQSETAISSIKNSTTLFM